MSIVLSCQKIILNQSSVEFTKTLLSKKLCISKNYLLNYPHFQFSFFQPKFISSKHAVRVTAHKGPPIMTLEQILDLIDSMKREVESLPNYGRKKRFNEVLDLLNNLNSKNLLLFKRIAELEAKILKQITS